MALWGHDRVLFTSEAADREQGPTWVDAWEAAPSGVVPHRCSGSNPISAFPNNLARSQTLRISIRPSVAGTAIRVRLSNRLSESPLVIRHVTVGVNRDVLFQNGRAVTIAAGADVISDTVVADVTPDRPITISIAIASGGPLTWHAEGPTSAYASSAGTAIYRLGLELAIHHATASNRRGQRASGAHTQPDHGHRRRR